MTDKINIINTETARLAPYAVKSRDTRGRRHAEPEHPFRSPFQRDRDRIIHCNAFRRLEYKTQVFVYHEGDHYRTRLTHTIEVAQIARTIARALALNEDLAEAIALAHDLGHPPFGHTGEHKLDELMKGHGGFEHNAHTMRIVEELEKRYPAFDGLNLTWEVREGIAKHGTDYDNPEKTDEYDADKAPTLEAQIVDLADEIAYNNHDIDDGLTSLMIDEGDLGEVDLWRESAEEAAARAPGADRKLLKYQSVKDIINRQVTDLVENTLKAITEDRVASAGDVTGRKGNLARFSTEMEKKNRQLKAFLKEKMYSHHRVLRMADKAERILESLFSVYANKPINIPPHFFNDVDKWGEKRVICDYLAGMTDRFALDEYKKLFDPYEKV